MEPKTEDKILIVDDEPEVCEAISRYFTRRGYNVVIATSAKEALSKVSAEKPALIILDILMPLIDGLECLRKIKEIDKEATVIIVTCVASVDTARKALELGAVDYVTKPLDYDELETLISVQFSIKKKIPSEDFPASPGT